MDDLEQRKLQAEIANVQAETQRALSESAKADAEARALKRSWREWSVEVVKVFGAIVLGAGGITAAITGYQISEAKKERMDLEIAKSADRLQALNRQLAAASAAKTETDAAVDTAKRQLEAINTEVDSLQTSLQAARDAKSGNSVVLNEAITRIGSIGKSVSSASAQLQAAAQSATALHSISDYLVGVQTLGVSDATREQLNATLRRDGYGLHRISGSYQFADRPSWFAPTSTVFYYAKQALPAAKKLADEMKKLTGAEFAVQQGAGPGAGVDPSDRDVVLFVHYVKK